MLRERFFEADHDPLPWYLSEQRKDVSKILIKQGFWTL